jgi:hypothetical protein
MGKPSKKLILELEQAIEESNKEYLSNKIKYSNYEQVASAMDVIFKRNTEKFKEKESLRETLLFVVELLLLFNLKKRNQSQEKKTAPVFKNELYSFLGSM